PLGHEGQTRQRIQSVQQPEPHGHAAAEPAGPRHFALDVPAKAERLHACRVEKSRGRFVENPRVLRRLCAPHGDMVVDAQRHSKAVKPRPEIGSRSGHAGCNAGHTHRGSASAPTPSNRNPYGPRMQSCGTRADLAAAPWFYLNLTLH